eukprot:3267673-Pyramimonas_sp.AAC.1
MPNTSDSLATYAAALRALRAAVKEAGSAHCMLIGDFNFALEEEGRMQGDGGGWTHGDRAHSRLFSSH